MNEERFLVWGGTPVFGSNRAEESGQMLQPVPADVEAVYAENLEKATTREEVANILRHMDASNINIVGSRDMVYLTSELAAIVDTFNPYHANFLTRSLGLRQKVFDLFMEERQGE